MKSEPAVQQLFDLTGKVALLSGATGHLGSAMARALAEAGANVVTTSRRLKDAQAAARSLPRLKKGQKHSGVELDQMNEASLHGAFDSAVDCFGRLDVLVNNAHDRVISDWTTVTPAEFNRQMANATAYFVLARLMRDHVVSRKATASIVLLASMYGMVGSYPEAYAGICPASPVAYHMLKGGLIQMARHLAAYWGKDGVRVNALSPGPFPMPRVDKRLIKRLEQKTPLGRVGKPDELKGAIVFLASDASSYMTGQNLVIDGGWTAW